MQNITIDSTNLTAIHYYPPLCNGTGWVETNHALAYQSTYTYCHGSYNSRAVLKFTGVAVYYQTPQWETQESMFFHLDDRASEEVDLTSPSGSSIASHVVWGVAGLANKQHTVELLPGRYDGEQGFVSVDAFIVTTSDGPIEDGSGSSSSSSKTPIAIGVGVGLGVVILMLLGLFAFFFLRKKRSANVSTPQTPTTAQPFLASAATGDGQMSQYSPGYDPSAYRQSAIVMPDPAMALYSTPPAQTQFPVTTGSGSHADAPSPQPIGSVGGQSTPSNPANPTIYV